MCLWMPFLLCRPHVTSAESSLSRWSPVLLCSAVSKWDRAGLRISAPFPLLQTPPSSYYIPPCSQPEHTALHRPLAPSCDCAKWDISPPSLLAFLKHLPYLCMWWGNSQVLKFQLVLRLPVTGFPSQCCNFLICCGRIVLAAHLHY